MVLYVPLVSLLTGIQGIPIDRGLLVISAVVFIGLPLAIGLVTKRLLTRIKGETWFEDTYRPAVERVAIGALLMTLIVLFSLNGEVLLGNFDAWEVPVMLSLVYLGKALGERGFWKPASGPQVHGIAIGSPLEPARAYTEGSED